MEQTISLSAEQYGSFLRCLSILKDHCNDIDIREGNIRQRSDENMSVFEIDLSSIIQDLSLPISDIKKKFDLFKIFAESDVEISVTENDDGNADFSVSDQYSLIRFKRPDLSYIDNTFMTHEEINNVFPLGEDDLILSCDISAFISERMKAVAGGFNVNSVEVLVEGEEASISAKTQAEDQFAKFISGIVTDKVLECGTHMIITPFIIDHDGDILFKMYNTQPEVSCNKFTATIDELEINIFTRSTLVDNSAETEDDDGEVF
jgi:hypothetical protein